VSACECPVCRGERPGDCWKGRVGPVDMPAPTPELDMEQGLSALAEEAAAAYRAGDLQRGKRLFAQWRQAARKWGLLR